MARICRFSLRLMGLLLLVGTVPASAAEAERTDGNALPEGAIGKLGASPFPAGRGGRLTACTRLSPDGKYYATLEETNVCLRSVETGTVIHTWPVAEVNRYYPLGFSPDGQVLTIVDSARIQMCDVGGKWNVTSFEWTNRKYFGEPVFSSDRKRFTLQESTQLAGGREQRKIVVWDLAQKKMLSTITAFAHCIAFSPDGKQLVTVNVPANGPGDENSGTLHLWDVDNGEEVKQQAFSSGVLGIAFSPDGGQLAVMDRTQSVRFWNVKTGKFGSTSFPTPLHYVSALRYSADGRKLIFYNLDSPVVLLDIATGESTSYRLPANTAIIDLALLPQARMLALGAVTSYSSVRIWELPSGKVLTPDDVHTGSVNGLVFSRDRRELLSRGSDGIRLWDISSLTTPGKQLEKTSRKFFAQPGGRVQGELESHPSLFFLSPGSQPLLVEPRNAAALAALAWQGDRVETDWGTYDCNQKATFAENGRLVAFVGLSGRETEGRITVESWDLKNGLRKGTASITQPPDEKPWVTLNVSYFTLSPDGRYLAMRRSINRDMPGADVLVVMDLRASKEVVHQVRPKRMLQATTFSPDSRLLYSVFDHADAVEVWDIEKAKALPALKGKLMADVSELRFSPDGRFLVAVTQSEFQEKEDGRLLVWEMASGSLRHEFSCGKRTGSVAFTADSAILASGGWDGSILLWNLAGHGETVWLPENLTAEQAGELWEALANPAAREAFPAMRKLMHNPQTALTLFRAKGGEAEGATPAKERSMRQVRMVEILERIGTPEARKMLQVLAKEDSDGRLAREAASALKRLSP